MSLAELLGSMSSAAFIEQYYLKLPFALGGGCQQFLDLGNWDTVERILAQPDADTLVVKSGSRRSVPQVLSYAEARALHAEGCTIVLRHAEQRDPAIARFAAGFRHDLLSPLDVHVYCTPASQFGFGWHYDAEDVFILQTAGCKEYSLRKNTVNPWPVLEAMPDDMGFQREIMPLVKCSLAAGDWLYIPGGYWHRAESREDSISVAIGVMSATALELVDFVRRRLSGSLVWRQRLPVTAQAAGKTADQVRAEYEVLCEQLGQDLVRVFSDPQTAVEFERAAPAAVRRGAGASAAGNRAGRRRQPAAGESAGNGRKRVAGQGPGAIAVQSTE